MKPLLAEWKDRFTINLSNGLDTRVKVPPIGERRGIGITLDCKPCENMIKKLTPLEL